MLFFISKVRQALYLALVHIQLFIFLLYFMHILRRLTVEISFDIFSVSIFVRFCSFDTSSTNLITLNVLSFTYFIRLFITQTEKLYIYYSLTHGKSWFNLSSVLCKEWCYNKTSFFNQDIKVSNLF